MTMWYGESKHSGQAVERIKCYNPPQLISRSARLNPKQSKCSKYVQVVTVSCSQYVFVAADTIPLLDVTIVLYYQHLQSITFISQLNALDYTKIRG